MRSSPDGNEDRGAESPTVVRERMRRARCVPDRPVNAGNSRSLPDNPIRVWDQEAISVVVTDCSPVPPVKRETTTRSEHGRGLQVVEALSAHWGWNHERGGKAVYAVLEKEG